MLDKQGRHIQTMRFDREHTGAGLAAFAHFRHRHTVFDQPGVGRLNIVGL